jgi:hypothetical protein
MKAPAKYRSVLLMVVAMALCVAAGGCKRADDTVGAGNGPDTAAPASVGASGLTGPAVTPAPAPPQGARE